VLNFGTTNVLNFLCRSAHWFADGSRLEFMTQEDSIRYRAPNYRPDDVSGSFEPAALKRFAFIPLSYDAGRNKYRVKDDVPWYWLDPVRPYRISTTRGLVLTDGERAEVTPKLRLFLAKWPRQFDPLS
jgi:hypothetical protein